MTSQRVSFHRLLGAKVYDPSGRFAGRIEEIVVDDLGDCCQVRQYLLGRRGLLERLSIAGLSAGLIRLLGARKTRASYGVPWDQMDLSDLSHPRVTCPAGQLPRLDAAPAGH